MEVLFYLLTFEEKVKDMKEIWVDIKGCEGLYQVSNFGNVKSLSRYVRTSDKLGGRRKKKETLLSLDVCKNGYLRVSINKGGSRKHFLVHRLVAEAFIPNPQNLPQVNHKDENKANNRVDNLEWCDAKYNSNYGERTRKSSIAKFKSVKQYDMQGNFIAEFGSLKEAWDSIGMKFSQASCRVGKSVGGYQWRMNDEPCGIYVENRGKTSKSRIKIITPECKNIYFDGYSAAAKFLGISNGYFGCIICGRKRAKKLCGYTIEWTQINGEVKIIKM